MRLQIMQCLQAAASPCRGFPNCASHCRVLVRKATRRKTPPDHPTSLAVSILEIFFKRTSETAKMGGVFSRACSDGPAGRACRRLKKLWNTSYWLTSNIAWISVTGAICLVAPVIFYYERECQMFEMQQQFMEAQQAAAQAQQMQQAAGVA